MLDQGRVDLAYADNDALDAIFIVDGAGGVSGVWNDPLEVAVTNEVFDVGSAERVSE